MILLSIFPLMWEYFLLGVGDVGYRWLCDVLIYISIRYVAMIIIIIINELTIMISLPLVVLFKGPDIMIRRTPEHDLIY
jgi:hypothetical protein